MTTKESMNTKQILFYTLCGAVILIVALFAIFQPTTNIGSGSLKDKTLAIYGDGFDYSQALYPVEEIPQLEAEVSDQVDEMKARESISVDQVIELARTARRVRDFNTAVELFELAQQQNPEDKYYLIDFGRIYLEMEEWEEARKIFEPLRYSYPVYDAYLGLANAYKQIEGTPQYVIDDIYQEGLEKNLFRFEVVQAYVDWLEETGREELTIPYYKKMQEDAPQQLLEDRINELEQKYPNAPREL